MTEVYSISRVEDALESLLPLNFVYGEETTTEQLTHEHISVTSQGIPVVVIVQLEDPSEILLNTLKNSLSDTLGDAEITIQKNRLTIYPQ